MSLRTSDLSTDRKMFQNFFNYNNFIQWLQQPVTMFVTCGMLGETNCKYFPDKHPAMVYVSECELLLTHI